MNDKPHIKKYVQKFIFLGENLLLHNIEQKLDYAAGHKDILNL